MLKVAAWPGLFQLDVKLMTEKRAMAPPPLKNHRCVELLRLLKGRFRF